MNNIKSTPKKLIDAIFSLVFSSAFCSEPLAKSMPPFGKREPKMPKEILDLID